MFRRWHGILNQLHSGRALLMQASESPSIQVLSISSSAWTVAAGLAVSTLACCESLRHSVLTKAFAETQVPQANAASKVSGDKGQVQSYSTTCSQSQPKGQHVSPSKPPRDFAEGKDFAVYNRSGERVALADLPPQLLGYDVVLLGEVHDDAVAHHLELQLLQATAKAVAAKQGVAAQRQQQVVLSLEMFERDVQHVVDEFLAGHIPETDLMRDARPWPNYHADYRPLVMAAKEQQMPVIAANAPRRYVSLVGRKGSAALSTLSDSSRQHLPPLPYPAPSQAYIDKIKWMMQQLRQAPPPSASASAQQQQESNSRHPAASSSSSSASGIGAPKQAPPAQQQAAPAASSSATSKENSGAAAASSSEQQKAAAAAAASSSGASSEEGTGAKKCPYIGLDRSSNFYASQSLWDASMGHAIAQCLDQLAEQRKAALVMHVCGKFHCEHRLGIVEALQHYAPSARVAVVAMLPTPVVAVSRQQWDAEKLGLVADYVILTNANLPGSFESKHI